jgi:thioredoxin reductase
VIDTKRKLWDVVIVGAGPAGLSAALVLGRCCRSVLVCDRGTPRSWASKAMHGFISRDGVAPSAFRRRARKELSRYPNVHYWRGEVKRVVRGGVAFGVYLQRRIVHARKLLLATGVFDQLPAIPGFETLFGRSVFPCPYCDGWEYRGRPVAVYGRGTRGFELTRALTAWTNDIVLCTDGPSRLSGAAMQQLQRKHIAVMSGRIERLSIVGRRLNEVVFTNGDRLRRDALFFDTPSRPQSTLPAQLGCSLDRHGRIRCGQYEATSVPGVFAAGNVLSDVQLSIVAAAEGARAAFGINRALTREDFDGRKQPRQPTRRRGDDRQSHPRLS